MVYSHRTEPGTNGLHDTVWKLLHCTSNGPYQGSAECAYTVCPMKIREYLFLNSLWSPLLLFTVSKRYLKSKVAMENIHNELTNSNSYKSLVNSNQCTRKWSKKIKSFCTDPESRLIEVKY